MKKVFVILTMLLVLFSVVLSPQVSADDKKANETYKALLAKAKASDPKLDFTEMRMIYAKTSFFNPYKTDKENKEMWDFFKSQKFREAAEKATVVLSTNYLDVDAQFICFISYKQIGDSSTSKHHYYMFRGIINSILQSGDGKTVVSAYKVISVPEEYALMNALGLKLIKQSLVEQNGKKFDKMEVTNSQTGENTTIFFNIDIPFNWLEKKMSGKGK